MDEINKDTKVISEILSYIFHNFNKPDLSLETFTCKLGLEKGDLENIFMSVTGNSFNGYLNEVRVLQARSYLLDTDLSTEEVALKVGYKSAEELYEHLEDDELNLL